MIERLREEDVVPDGLDPADEPGLEGSPRGTPLDLPSPAPGAGGADGAGQEEGVEGAAGGAGVAGGAEAAAESALRIEAGELRSALEAVLFSVSEPITIRALSDLFSASVHEVREAVEELRIEYIDSGRAFRIEDIAGGIQVLTLPRYDPWIRCLRQKEGEGRLSPAALESLAVIAYKQPINKADLEAIRGVGCGPTLKTLLDRGLVQIVGRGEGLGKPLLYGTTRRFLESFGIASVRDLPQPELERPPGAPGDGPPGAMEMERMQLPPQILSHPDAAPEQAAEDMFDRGSSHPAIAEDTDREPPPATESPDGENA
ncbi:MAG TPA: SMC-Scp complex subunit ScpB [Planctomycetota bacterium]|nr:SMC-Scp complex subunit ScpB [Planctomycetota bacterium]